MSTGIVLAAQGPFQQAYTLLSTFIERCPDNIWKERNGGWPVWQQVAHALSSLPFFAGAPAGSVPAPCALEVLRLAVQGMEPLSKERMQAYAAQCKASADAYIAGLRDEQLAEENAVLSAGIGFSVTHAATLGMFASHVMYHLGSCDAALRDHGLPGVF